MILVSEPGMKILRNLILVMCWLVLLGLVKYEVVHKAPRTSLGPLPGSALADLADQRVRYRSLTGVRPVDRVLHEGQEAYLYYRWLATGKLP